MKRLIGGLVVLTAALVGCESIESDIATAEVTRQTPSENSISSSAGSILRIDPRFDELVPRDAQIEKLADGFIWTEGPVWLRRESRLLFSDDAANTIYQWSEEEGVSIFMQPVHEGDMEGFLKVGSNGLTIDSAGRLVMAELGHRRIARLEEDGSKTTLVENYEGGRLNSSNDLVFGADGSLYFTDPPSALEGRDESPLKELDFNGVFRLSPSGDLQLLVSNLSRPNGIALSPDESTLYVSNSRNNPIWMAYDLNESGVSNARAFYDPASVDAPGVPDGMKLDISGNIFATGPGGVWVFTPDGAHLGTIQPDEPPANVAWGDDGHTLYMTARTGLYRLRTNTEGNIPGP